MKPEASAAANGKLKGMGEHFESREDADLRSPGAGLAVSEADAWFVREVLPLESALLQFLRHNWRNASEIDDFLQDIYVRVFESARKQLPESAKLFVFATARNLLIDRVRRARIIPIEAVSDLETVDVALHEEAPDRIVMARDELRRLQDAVDRLPPRCREAIMLKQVEGLTRREIAQRMGVGEETVKRHLTNAMLALAYFFLAEKPAAGAAK
jgi:RNA polymerase sigma-70 factor (ECF subfamily)